MDNQTDKESLLKAIDINTLKALDKLTKIGVYKELCKKGLLTDYELSVLIAKPG